MRALVVDDNKINLMVAKKSIQPLFDVVDEALSGKDCIDLVNKNKYDIILMDIMMPEMDGVETLHKLKEIDGFETPVMAVTADAEAGAEDRYLSEGFVAYVTKPFTPDSIKERIKEFV